MRVVARARRLGAARCRLPGGCQREFWRHFSRERTGQWAASDSSAPRTELTPNLAEQSLSRADELLARFPVAPFVKHCLLRGIDELEFLLDAAPTIASFEARRQAGHLASLDGVERTAVPA